MKYVMFRTKARGGLATLIPIIFPSSLVHGDVARAMFLVLGEDVKLVSAGECIIDCDSTHGSSTTLALESSEDDANVITRHDYYFGIVDDPESARLDYEAKYAAESRMTIDELHKHGLYAEACDCGEQSCEGWKMVSRGRKPV